MSTVYLFDRKTKVSVPVTYDDGCMGQIVYEHLKVHHGEMFMAEHSASVNNGANLDIQLLTGAVTPHLVLGVNVTGQCTMTLYEAPTTTAAGTAIASYNMNRNSALVPGAAFTHGPTVTATGTTNLINGRILPGGNSAQTRIGAGARTDTEFVLLPATKYLLRITNGSGSTAIVNVFAEFYEDAG
jgi:hypothetical protein